MNYITAAKLQNKLEGEVSQTMARKLIDKMTLEGFTEASSNRRLGKYTITKYVFSQKLTMLNSKHSTVQASV